MSEEELRRLAQQHYDRIFRAARFMSGEAEAAEELTQETFLVAAESLDRFERRSSSYTWLYGILLNKFRRWLRRKGRRAVSLQRLAADSELGGTSELLEEAGPGPHEAAERREAARHVRRAVDELTADHRAVVVLRFMEDLSYQEIAEALDCPIGTVKSRIHYALKEIGAALHQDEGRA